MDVSANFEQIYGYIVIIIIMDGLIISLWLWKYSYFSYVPFYVLFLCFLRRWGIREEHYSQTDADPARQRL